ncbi:MAG TPA: hypothetical protein VK453_15820 [Micromonosporaceae bacterium]|nr:hypothetical protein [Micromonosporaceae bacterium]
MLVQQRLIARVRSVCAGDGRLVAALMYGSFAAGTADAHSDVEFWLFFRPDRHGEIDPARWCAQIAALRHVVTNEFGTVVAFFPGLVRGEFHFASADDIGSVRAWAARGAPIDRMVVLDRDGTLRSALEALPERATAPASSADVLAVCGRFANWLVLAHQVAGRGETLRAWDALGHVHRHLLWIVRLVEGETTHWLTPSRGAEVELSVEALAVLRETTAPADTDGLRAALVAAWRHGRRCWIELAQRHGASVPHALFADLDTALRPDAGAGAPPVTPLSPELAS